MLITMRYADEIRGASGFELPAEGLKSAGVSSKEVDLAKRLVDDMTEHWKPEEFKDTYHEDLMRRIHEKIKAGRNQGDHQAGRRRTSERAPLGARSSISPRC